MPRAIEGVSLRSFAFGEDDRAVHSAHQESFADHWGFVKRDFDAWAGGVTARAKWLFNQLPASSYLLSAFFFAKLLTARSTVAYRSSTPDAAHFERHLVIRGGSGRRCIHRSGNRTDYHGS